ATSLRMPPRNVANTRLLPVASSLATTTSRFREICDSSALVNGKPAMLSLQPQITAQPEMSTAMPVPTSSPSPPRYVEYSNLSPSALSLQTKISARPELLACTAWFVGNPRVSNSAPMRVWLTILVMMTLVM